MKKTVSKHQNKSLLVKIITTMFAMIMVFSLIPVNSSAKTFTRSYSAIGSKSMNPTADELRALSGYDIVKGSKLYKDVRLPKAYSFVAYKFTEDGLPSHNNPYGTTGWYSFRTNGYKDTVGELYTTKYVMSGWPWNWHYETRLLAQNDDSTNYGTDYEIVYKMTEGESVYLCSRIYGGGTGGFEVIVEPYRDVLKSDNGGYWKVINSEMVNTGSYYGYNVVESKYYLTKDQVASMYEMNRQMIADAVISKERLGLIKMYDGYPAAVETLYSIYGDVLLSFAPSWIKTLKDYAGKISEYLTPSFKEAVNILIGDESEYADICIQLEDVCGAKYQNGKCSAQDGVVITKYNKYTAFGYLDFTDYMVYNDTTLYGSEYEKGTWNKVE